MLQFSEISIIITTKNEEKNIDNCLMSILPQTYLCDRIEIIVVDNDSSDKTKEIALKYTDKVFDKGPERSAQRNFGMMIKAQGEYVMYLDADMILSPDLVKSCVDYIQKENCAALHISEIVLGQSFWSKVRRFERSFYDGTVIDGARFFRKDIFIKVGGFDETMSGPEDWDIDKKIKQIGQIGLVPAEGEKAVIFHNEAEFNLKRYLGKKTYYAQSFGSYINKWGKNDPDIKKQLGLWYRYFGVFIEKGKWKKMISHPVLTFGMYFLRVMVGIKYLIKNNK
jgi:glycosyltransferase involved in cell wall biosynthesis